MIGFGWWACAAPGPDGAEPAGAARAAADLVDEAAWTASDPQGDDPLDDAPVAADCAASGVYVEGGSIEVDTEKCGYAWLQQPLLADLRPGDRVDVVFWHSVLVADPPAEGHVALVVGDHVLYERRIPIPAESTAYTETAEVGFAAEAGVPIGLHLHNHGANTWNVLTVRRLSSDDP